MDDVDDADDCDADARDFESGPPGCCQDVPPASGTRFPGCPLGYGDLAERIEFAVPDGVGVPGVI